MKTNQPRHKRYCVPRLFATALFAFVVSALFQVCIGQEFAGPTNGAPIEQLPPANSSLPNVPALPDQCKPAPTDNPLFTLTTDIRPRARDGKIVSLDHLPFNCAGLKPVQEQMMSIDQSCDTCYPGYCDVLSMARFCHNPLYFNDECLERCGRKHCCCQPCASAMCFYGRALLLPITACCVCPCSCVPSGGCCP